MGQRKLTKNKSYPDALDGPGNVFLGLWKVPKSDLLENVTLYRARTLEVSAAAIAVISDPMKANAALISTAKLSVKWQGRVYSYSLTAEKAKEAPLGTTCHGNMLGIAWISQFEDVAHQYLDTVGSHQFHSRTWTQ
jgi:hypothetical protein